MDSTKGELEGTDMLKEQALLPIMRGGSLREGIAGHIEKIHTTFVNGQTGKENVKKYVTRKDVNIYDWKDTHMFKCSKCKKGFL